MVYANYGRIEELQPPRRASHRPPRKIASAAYGANFRGVKVYSPSSEAPPACCSTPTLPTTANAQGRCYPIGARGGLRPAFNSARCIPLQYPGDPETAGVASTLDLPDSARISNEKSGTAGPRIVSVPISYHDPAPILRT